MTQLQLIDLLDRNIGLVIMVTRIHDDINNWHEENNENSTKRYYLNDKEGEYYLNGYDDESEGDLDIETITAASWFSMGGYKSLHLVVSL